MQQPWRTGRSNPRLSRSIGILTAGLLLCAGAAARSQATVPHTTIVHAGRLLDRPGQASRGPSSIVIVDGRISEITAGFLDRPGATVIDLRDRFVLPGLIDSHVHISFEFTPALRTAFAERDPADFALAGAAYAGKTLQAGFTTVRDLGSPSGVALALRDAIEVGRIAGPTILAAGQMISATAGHADLRGFNALAAQAASSGYLGVACDGPSECMKRVREQAKAGADVIKLAVTGGVLSESKAGLSLQMDGAELAAAVSAARQQGLPVAIHAHSKAGIEAAIAAGVDSIEHGSFLDDQSAALVQRSGAFLVPTLTAVTGAAEQARAGRLSAPMAAKALSADQAARKGVAIAVRNGIPIAFGTDSGITPHGQNAREFALLVAAGLSPAEAVASATTNAASLLGRSDRIGSVEVGKDADLIAVANDPTVDVEALGKIEFVMRRGIVHRIGGRPMAFIAR
jgi:imidazolonepropionase-like amidohydrolase